ncbi:DNA circularization protein [Achromobacter anxifer]
MSWEQNLQDASFKGVRFDCVMTRELDERDVAEYLYPYRDGGVTEDLGRGLRRLDLVAVLWGDDYDSRLQALLQKLEEPGPGELIHPIYGAIPDVQLKGKRVEHEADRPNYATVYLTFLEGGEENPFFVRQLPAQKADSASLFAQYSADLGASDFASFMSSLKTKPDFLVRLNAIRDATSTVLSAVRGLADHWITSGLDIADFPRAFVADLAGGLKSLVNLSRLTGDGLMPRWGALTSALGDVVKLPRGITSGDTPARFDAAIGPDRAPVPMPAADLAAVDAMTKTTVANVIIEAAADILAEQAENPTLAPAEIEQIANDTRGLVQEAVDAQRVLVVGDTQTPDGAHEPDATISGRLDTDAQADRIQQAIQPLKDAAKSIQEAATEVINLLPPLRRRSIQSPANLRLQSFRWYGTHTRASEIARLNPNLRNPNDLQPGDTLYGFAK